jgi:hypothetical protein
MEMIGQLHAPIVFTLYRVLNNTDYTSETVVYKAESHTMMIMIMMMIIVSRDFIRCRRKNGGLWKCTRLL